MVLTSFHKLICNPYILISVVSGQILCLLKKLSKGLTSIVVFVRYVYKFFFQGTVIFLFFVIVPFEGKLSFDEI